jgi:hypothetical protein
MQDGTQVGGNEAYIILHRGARSRGYMRRERARVRARERERVWPSGELSELASSASLLLCLPLFARPVPACVRLSPLLRAYCPRLPLCQRSHRALGRPRTSPFIDTRRCPAVQWGCSYVLTWLAEKCLEPCTRANVAVGEVP